MNKVITFLFDPVGMSHYHQMVHVAQQIKKPIFRTKGLKRLNTTGDTSGCAICEI